MPVLTRLLQAFRLRATVFHNAQYCGTWGVDTSREDAMSFHFVVRGQCAFSVGHGRDETLAMRPGDLVVLPRGVPHLMGSSDCPADTINRVASTPHDDSPPDDAVALMCGHIEFDDSGPNPVLDALPEHVVLRTTEPPHDGLLAPITTALRNESLQGGEGSAAVIDRLAEVLFVHVLRIHLSEHRDLPGLAAALADPNIRRAIEALHDDPEAKHTVNTLATVAGMSRSSFAERFRRVVGVAPMDYCARWKMQCAYRWLADEDITVFEAAQRCGYDSEAAFSRAFKRITGVNPSAARRR